MGTCLVQANNDTIQPAAAKNRWLQDRPDRPLGCNRFLSRSRINHYFRFYPGSTSILPSPRTTAIKGDVDVPAALLAHPAKRESVRESVRKS
jgi:hypothetical protein